MWWQALKAKATSNTEAKSTQSTEVYQHQGVGHCLFLASCRSLQDAGMGSMLLWVLEDNHGARRFYESMGGEPINSKSVNIGGIDFTELAYGWEDIAQLVR